MSGKKAAHDQTDTAEDTIKQTKNIHNIAE